MNLLGGTPRRMVSVFEVRHGSMNKGFTLLWNRSSTVYFFDYCVTIAAMYVSVRYDSWNEGSVTHEFGI